MTETPAPVPQRITFNQAMPVEATALPFTLLDSVRHLDTAELAKAEHVELEIGYYEGNCKQFVRAVVERGIVTQLNLDPCGDMSDTDIAPEVQAALKEAVRRLAPKRRRGPWKPIPIARLASSIGTGLTIDTITCVRICIWGHCIVCCTTINSDLFHCGDRVIIHTD